MFRSSFSPELFPCFSVCVLLTPLSHPHVLFLSLSRTKESSHPIRRSRSTVLIKSGRSLAVRERVIRSLYIHSGQNFSGRLQIGPNRSGEPAREHGDVDTHSPPGGIACVHNSMRNMISRNVEKDGLFKMNLFGL